MAQTIVFRWVGAGLVGALIGIAAIMAASEFSAPLVVGFAVGLLALAEWMRQFYGPEAGVVRSLAHRVEACAGKDLQLPETETGWRYSLFRLLLQALNRYGRSISRFVGQTSNKSNQVVLVSKTLAESAQFVTEQADQQAARTGELATAMEEMSATIQEIARNASHTFEGANRIAQANAEGLQNMEKVVADVGDVSRMFEQVLGAMADLRKASDDIGRVVKVINELAEQTNLLALNAAIEAARAGEQGRGFAVVADEVRNLAERTKKSTQEISETVSRNQHLGANVAEIVGQGRTSVDKSVEQVRITMDSLKTVSSRVDEVHGMIHQIASATEEQSAVVGEITRNIEHIARLSQDTTTRAQAAHKLSLGMEAIAKDLEGRVNVFDLSFFGLAPVEDAIQMNQSFGPLCEHLSKLLERDLYLRLGHDYHDAIEDLGNGRALLSYQTPSTYVEARHKYGIEPLVVPLAKGEPFYRSAIVVRADAGINDLAQLRGQSFAFGDAKSTGSKAMPESMLRGAGIGLGDLSKHGFLGSHDNVAKAVLQKAYAGGGLMLSVAEKYTGQGLKIIATSAPIPQFPICAAPAMPAAAREKIIEALTGLKDERILRALGSHVTGFARIQDRDYDGVREMLRKLAS
jgi:phosphate/phosphite/phosphonate ABC transporter binding protein